MTKFKECRVAKGLTQEQLIEQFNTKYGKKYGVSSISMFENGKRIPETQSLIDFADFFGVTVDYLLGRPGNPSEFFTHICVARKDLTRREVAAKLGLTADDVRNLDAGTYEKLPPEAIKKIYTVYMAMNTQNKITLDAFQLAATPNRDISGQHDCDMQDNTYEATPDARLQDLVESYSTLPDAAKDAIDNIVKLAKLATKA